MPAETRFLVVGGGLGGSLVAIYLARAGHRVELYERRSDPRRTTLQEGRSINLAISTRGIHALAGVGLAERVLQEAVPMRGRMLHDSRGRLAFQPYGTEPHHAIHSVSRSGLNRLLIEAAAEAGVALHFGSRCRDLDPERARVCFVREATGEQFEAQADAVVGADGAFSAVRARLMRLERFDYHQEYLDYGYKELTIPPGPGGAHQLEPHALHIWPRGGHMMIALPNRDGSFTCTIFWPCAGPISFAAVRDGAQLLEVFERELPDARPLMPQLVEEFFAHPVGSLVTIRCRPWHYRDKVVLLGDACHAVVPFYGQGANASFEDCTVLDACLRDRPEREAAFAEYERRRRVHTDALAALALENFVEMRDRVATRRFLWGKALERTLHRLVPWLYVPLYTLVTFSLVPYAEARARHRRQRRRLICLGSLLLAALVLAASAALCCEAEIAR